MVDSVDLELAAIGLDVTTGGNLIPGEVVITDVLEPRLSNRECLGEALTLHQEGEVVATIVGVVDFSNLDGVISQEVVDDERKLVEVSEEAQHTAIVVEELLLRLNAATTK